MSRFFGRSVTTRLILLYTAVTRGKQLVVLLGTRKALGMAVRRAETGQRYTALKQRLESALPGAGS